MTIANYIRQAHEVNKQKGRAG